MPNIIEITDFTAPELDVYARLTEAQLMNRFEPEKALFFVQKTVENGWSRAMLLNFLDTDLYQHQGKAITNFS